MTGHTYPSRYGRGLDPDLDAAWDIIDRIPVGVLDECQRAYLAGCIVGTIIKARNERPKTNWEKMWEEPFWPKD